MQKKLGTSFIGFILLLLWIEMSKYWCYALFIPLMFFILITSNSYSYAKAKKICLGKCYFDENSIIYFFWTRKGLILIFSSLLGVLFTLSLVMASFQFDTLEKSLFFVDSFFIVFLYTLLEKNKTFNPNVKVQIIKNITAWVNALLFVVVLFLIALYQTPPEYLQLDLQNTLKTLEEEQYSSCTAIDELAYLSSIIVATKWWLLSKATFILENEYLKQLLWFLQLLGNFMMVFAYSRFILELLTLFSIQKEDKNEG